MNVQECLLKMAELTSQNLTILKALNESFYTKQLHTLTEVDGERFVIPSFLSLENKVNHLQDAYDNLVHAAKSGDAWMNFDGNSKHIMLQGFSQAPNPIEPQTTKYFGVEDTYPFKDMLTPQPYINFDLSSLPDNISQVVVKKVVIYNDEILGRLGVTDEQATQKLAYGDLMTVIKSMGNDIVAGNDYLEYETVYNLPVCKITCDGHYVIDKIIDDTIDSDLDEHITVHVFNELKNQDGSAKGLVYSQADGITEELIPIGAELTSYDGSCHLIVEAVYPSLMKMKLKVLHGSYVHFIEDTGDNTIISDYSRLRFLRPDQNTTAIDKQLHVPLEEDKYVFICVAPLNSTIRVQSMWGTGLMVVTDNLIMGDSDAEIGFRNYYNTNVKNIGDALVELTNISSPSITKYSASTMKKMLNTKPIFNPSNNETLQVVQINKHLNDSEAASNIRALYKQKKQYQIDLQEVQSKIELLQGELSQISFDDMSGTRSMYTAQITDLKKQQNEIINSINKSMDSISLAASNAEIPISAAKYHVRGYFDIDTYLETIAAFFPDEDKSTILDNIVGIDVRYRYQNPDHPNANVAVINNFLFTEWVRYTPPYREKVMEYKDGRYNITYKDLSTSGTLNITENNTKFNQIDVPISQGEIVDIQVRVVWTYGYPFTKTATDWSETTTIEFPPELVKDVTIKSIIEENNSDIENYRFEKLLREEGVTTHIEDEFDDQDVKYFHKPENISSGFYTEERRVIPLRDKLTSMSADISELKDTIQGTFGESVQVTFNIDNSIHNIEPGIDNQVHITPYSSVAIGTSASGSAFKYTGDGPAHLSGLITIKNVSAHTVNLFSLIPGPYTDDWDKISTYPYSNMRTWMGQTINYVINDGLIMQAPVSVSTPRKSIIVGWQDEGAPETSVQRCNQWVTFLSRNIYNGSGVASFSELTQRKYLYLIMGGDPEDKVSPSTNELISQSASGWGDIADTYKLGDINEGTLFAGILLPNEFDLSMKVTDIMTKKTLAPGESITVPIAMIYKLGESAENNAASYQLGFVLRHSLYTDPMYYQITINAKFNQSLIDSLSAQKAKVNADSAHYNITVR